MIVSEWLQQKLRVSGLFDNEWYCNRYADVGSCSLSPLEHFIQYGWMEGRAPSARFDPAGYLAANPDVQQSGLSALEHYLKWGQLEGRVASYQANVKDVLRPAGLPNWVLSKNISTSTNPTTSDRERVLYVLPLDSGGTPKTNEDLMSSLASRAECLVLRCIGSELSLYYFYLGEYYFLEGCSLTSPLHPIPHSSLEYDQVLAGWLKKYSVTIVHVRHLAWQSLGLILSAKYLQIPVVFSYHDYYTICPSVKLLDEKKRFCGGRCTLSSGECSQELWAPKLIPELKFNAIYKWQQQYARALVLCDAFVTTTESVRQLILDIYPALQKYPFKVIPHGRDFSNLSLLATPPRLNQGIRVLVPGFLAVSKGRDILLELASHPKLVHVEWHVLGQLIDMPSTLIPNNIVVHGVYDREDFSMHVKRIQPHLGAVLSIWPETWCHTLTELWSVGLPVIGFKLGAVGERLEDTQGGWSVENISSDAIADKLLEVSEPGVWNSALTHVHEWQKFRQTSCAEMAEAYWTLYQEVLRKV